MGKKTNYDWGTIQTFYDSGKTFQEITEKFGPCTSAIKKAFARGSLIGQRTASESAKIGGKKVARERDWNAIQLFYNEGNSWAAVTANFGIGSRSIQTAIAAGHLVGRTRSASVCRSIQQRGLNVRFREETCRRCEKPISGNKLLYCSSQCSVEHQWKIKTLPTILNGTAGARATKEYLLRRSPSCVECGLGTLWNGKPLSLHMDHINGDSDNNSLDNVRLLCPNCHTQTPTFGIKNKGARSKRNLYMKDFRSK